MKTKIISALLFIVCYAFAQTNPNAIISIWETENKDARMEIFKNGNNYEGKLLWGDKIVEADGKTSKKDNENPNIKLRSRNLIGIVNLTGLKYNDGEYEDGQIYDPPSGKTYDCKAWLEDGKLHLRGFIGMSLLGRTAVWNKIK